MVGVSASTLSKWRSGTQAPERDKLERLAEVVNVTQSGFFGHVWRASHFHCFAVLPLRMSQLVTCSKHAYSGRKTSLWRSESLLIFQTLTFLFAVHES